MQIIHKLLEGIDENATLPDNIYAGLQSVLLRRVQDVKVSDNQMDHRFALVSIGCHLYPMGSNFLVTVSNCHVCHLSTAIVAVSLHYIMEKIGVNLITRTSMHIVSEFPLLKQIEYTRGIEQPLYLILILRPRFDFCLFHNHGGGTGRFLCVYKRCRH